MTIRIGIGRGYCWCGTETIGVIMLLLLLPVRRCTMNVTYCVGQRTDYDKLVSRLRRWLLIASTEAVCRAANIINQYMGAFLAFPRSEEEGRRSLRFRT